MIHFKSIVIKKLIMVVGRCSSLTIIIHLKIIMLIQVLYHPIQKIIDLIKTYKILDFKKEKILLNLDSSVPLIIKNLVVNKNNSCIGKQQILIFLK